MIRSDLVKVDVIEPGIPVLGDLREMRLRVGAARNRFGYVVLRHHGRRLLEVARQKGTLNASYLSASKDH